jgi:hypothetical protein
MRSRMLPNRRGPGVAPVLPGAGPARDRRGTGARSLPSTLGRQRPPLERAASDPGSVCHPRMSTADL